ncbi:hypothetical protein, partial [Carnobacterium jeotgali]|uniref:hypothetical protein n=1 Tax=Carnobacterium jeotgali TaxID=545534 RepID=UPI00388D3C4A
MINDKAVEDLKDLIESHKDEARNWAWDIPVVPVGELISWLDDKNTLNNALKDEKTAPVPSSKSYLHSRITKEL